MSQFLPSSRAALKTALPVGSSGEADARAARPSGSLRSALVRCWLGVVLATLVPEAAFAQSMRVFTSVKNLGANPQNPPVLAESLTLFHAGKVYDYMENVGEVVIFEPVQNRFTVLSPSYTATEVTFVELQQFLKSARNEAQALVDSQATDARTRRLIPALQRQLHPLFREQIRDAEVRLSADGLTYRVETSTPPDAASAETYLNYADWAARLNFVLHPQSLLPEPRLALNEVLRRESRLPVKVDLHVKLDQDVHLRAEHRFGWKLLPVDRQYIDQWERRRESPDVQWVSLHEYQAQLLAASPVRE